MTLFYPFQKFMLQKISKNLIINPGTRYLGLAAFESQDLVYWGVKVFKGKWSKQKMKNVKTVVNGLVKHYRIDMIVLKKITASRSSTNLNCLVESIEKLARQERIKISFYSLEDIKKRLAGGARVNKMTIAELVVKRYPFLANELEREKKHKHFYFIRMFEAIAGGIIFHNCCK